MDGWLMCVFPTNIAFRLFERLFWKFFLFCALTLVGWCGKRRTRAIRIGFSTFSSQRSLTRFLLPTPASRRTQCAIEWREPYCHDDVGTSSRSCTDGWQTQNAACKTRCGGMTDGEWEKGRNGHCKPQRNAKTSQHCTITTRWEIRLQRHVVSMAINVFKHAREYFAWTACV